MTEHIKPYQKHKQQFRLPRRCAKNHKPRRNDQKCKHDSNNTKNDTKYTQHQKCKNAPKSATTRPNVQKHDRKYKQRHRRLPPEICDPLYCHPLCARPSLQNGSNSKNNDKNTVGGTTPWGDRLKRTSLSGRAYTEEFTG